MPELVIPNLRHGYLTLVDWVNEIGDEVSPRGIPTTEIQGALVVVENPYDTLPTGIGRKISPGIAAVEACQLLAGETRPKLVMQIGPQFANFVEDNGEFHGAYGPRTRGQFEVMIKRLRDDPDSRQAVTTIWDKRHDLNEGKRDYPCTLTFTFHIRDGKLNMRTHMRSNDVMKGVGYDYFQFTRVQIAMASVLDVPVGRYFHYADSLHLYHSDLSAAAELHDPDKHDEEGFIRPPVFIAPGFEWHDIVERAHECLQMAEYPGDYLELDVVQWWYADHMLDCVRRNVKARREADGEQVG